MSAEVNIIILYSILEQLDLVSIQNYIYNSDHLLFDKYLLYHTIIYQRKHLE
jgi:hypothetical protein